MKNGILGFLLGATVVALMFLAMYIGDTPQRAAGNAAASGDLRKLKMARILGAQIDEPVGGMGPLIVIAARNGRQEIIKYLCDQGTDLETKDKFGGTALSRASQMGRTATVEMLIKMGANVQVQDLEGGNTPIDLFRMNAGRTELLLSTHGGVPLTTGK